MTRLAMSGPKPQPWMRRLAADLFLWTCIGLVMAYLGPFGTAERPLSERLAYWLCCMVGGGLIGIGIDELVRRKTKHFWRRAIATSALMTPFVTLLVEATNAAFYGDPMNLSHFWMLWLQVFVVSFASMTFRQFAWAGVAVPAPAADAPQDPTATFRLRLSAKRRAAAILAIEAEDHYLRVHTDAGDELITSRLRDALTELAAAPGFHVHRSWWVAADAIEDVRWLRGRGELRLKSGRVVPVSRSQARPLKDAGWF